MVEEVDYYSVPNMHALGNNQDPEFTEYLRTNPPVKVDFTADKHKLSAERRAKEEARAHATPSYGTKELTKNIAMRDGYLSEICITQPAKESQSGLPLIALIYGGGWLLGTNYQLIPVARLLAEFLQSGCATYDIYDSVKWLGSNASSLGANPEAGFILGGVSAGGSMTAVVAQQLHTERFSSPLTGQWLSVPNLLAKQTVPRKYQELWFSRDQNTHVPGLTTSDLDVLDTYYEPDVSSPDWSPINAGPPDKDPPPLAYIQVCGCDPLPDDGLIWEHILKDNGVKTKLDVYPGVPHVHFSSYPHLAISRKANIDTIAGIGWLLGEVPTRDEISGKVKTTPGGG